MDADTNATRGEEASLLVYVNGSHEYVIFDPRNNEVSQISKHTQKNIQADEPGELYGFVVHCFNLLISIICVL
jgi:NET1-associated nuclear protein 1 (U3 small nucleolar RNA-associated protein 17)